ncbi:hypothetical protein [Aliivibrio fischeri]|uniref:hypothetical protein n=1 Tax=Aliivibrio fischeri TaxID=668 RepID=UPI00080E1E6F|nr:hypothetical protein [Aliivibrio fischeri]OCH36616.1 hypothetical protein A6D99_15565 [Aliivibrio fischeri]
MKRFIGLYLTFLASNAYAVKYETVNMTNGLELDGITLSFEHSDWIRYNFIDTSKIAVSLTPSLIGYWTTSLNQDGKDKIDTPYNENLTTCEPQSNKCGINLNNYQSIPYLRNMSSFKLYEYDSEYKSDGSYDYKFIWKLKRVITVNFSPYQLASLRDLTENEIAKQKRAELLDKFIELIADAFVLLGLLIVAFFVWRKFPFKRLTFTVKARASEVSDSIKTITKALVHRAKNETPENKLKKAIAKALADDDIAKAKEISDILNKMNK